MILYFGTSYTHYINCNKICSLPDSEGYTYYTFDLVHALKNALKNKCPIILICSVKKATQFAEHIYRTKDEGIILDYIQLFERVPKEV